MIGRITGTLLAGLTTWGLAGCSDSENESAAEVTWHQDIAPLVSEKCTACHQEGGIAPFSLETYSSAKAFAPQIASAVMEGRMPPFLAQETDECQPQHPWANDLRLSAEQKAKIQKWVDLQTPEGNAAKAAELKHPALVVLEREDVVMPLPEAITVEGKQDIHTCIVVDPKLATDAYVTGRLITSGNAKVLHHVVSYIIVPGENDDGTPRDKAQLEQAILAEKGVGIGGRYPCFGGPGFTSGKVGTEMLDAWAPGGVPNLAPEDSGQPIAKDSLVVMDVHYHPTGTPQVDSATKLSLMLSTSRPSRIARTVLLGNFTKPTDAPLITQFGDGALLTQPDETSASFVIPANAKDHVEEMTWTWKTGGLRVTGMGTHMHYVGRNMRVTLEHANGDKECLIETPAWNFNWQRGYGYDASFDQLPLMSAGDVLRIRCVFDNTMQNPYVVQALDDQGFTSPVDVPLGEDTLNEMCLAAVGISYLNTNP
jgi:hypothetical protein